jgi:hypothetical protein
MNKNKVQFSRCTSVHEVERVDESWYHELFYQNADLERFQTDEKQRWERAYAKRLRKLAAKNGQLADVTNASGIQEKCNKNDVFTDELGQINNQKKLGTVSRNE